MSFKIIQKPIDLSNIFFLFSLAIALISYLFGMPNLYYIAFFILIISLLLMTYAMLSDLVESFGSFHIPLCLMGFIIIIYYVQRQIVFDSSFMIGDSSDYFWSGVSSALYGDDIGFFPPLTAALSAIGYQFFGLVNTSKIVVLFYFSILPLFYFLLRKLDFTSIQSYVFILFFQSIPLSIWFSKVIYSESLWQVFIVLLIYYSYAFIKEKKLAWTTLVILSMLLFLSVYIRGSAVILYGWLIFLSLYHFWYFGNFRNAVLLAIGMFILAFCIHYSLTIRARYLLEWQYTRLIPGITSSHLMSILYSIPFIYILFLSMLNLFKKRFMQSNFPFMVVVVSILLKIGMALYFSTKKQLHFVDMLYMNELGLAIGNFGIFITIMIVIGIVYMYYEASKGNRLLLLIIVLYTLFLIPLNMQNSTFEKEHIQLFYWNRYYFSEIFIIHFVAFTMAVRLMYNLLSKFMIKVRYKIWYFIGIILILYGVSINMRLYYLVTTEGYLENTSKIFSWVSNRLKGKNVALIYSADISYNNFDAKHLLHKGFYVTGVKIKKYQKVYEKQLNFDFIPKDNMLKSDFLLCLSTKSCKLNPEKFKLSDNFSTIVRWREHRDNLSDNAKKSIPINISLYKIKEK